MSHRHLYKLMVDGAGLPVVCLGRRALTKTGTDGAGRARAAHGGASAHLNVSLTTTLSAEEVQDQWLRDE